jgi:hypothetical protein
VSHQCLALYFILYLRLGDWLFILTNEIKPFFFPYQGVELRASCLLDRPFSTWVMPPALLALIIFEIKSCFMLASLNRDPPIQASLCS